jgi:integrase
MIQHVEQDGQTKYSADSALSKKIALLLKKANIKAKRGVGFYTLRRTAATLAAKSGDPFAVQTLLGHTDLKMASVYVQDVSEQTDRSLNNSRKLLLQEKEQK